MPGKLSRSGATRLKRSEASLRTNPGTVEGDPRGKADTCVQVNCPHSPLARFLVPFFRAEKRNCPPHRRKGIVRRSFGASTERLKFSLCRFGDLQPALMPQAANCSFCCSTVYSSMTRLYPGNRRFFLFLACAHAARAVTFCCSTKSNQKGNQGRNPITTPRFLRQQVFHPIRPPGRNYVSDYLYRHFHNICLHV